MKIGNFSMLGRAFVLAAGVSGAVSLAHAQSIPVFTCIGGTTPGALSGPAIASVFNTQAVSLSTTPLQPGNQVRWEWLNAAPTGATPPATIPAGAWTAFNGSESLPPSLSWPAGLENGRIGFFPAQTRGANWGADTLSFYRYQFQLAPEVSPTSVNFEMTGLVADDAIAGIYLNGTLVSSGPVSGTFTIPATAPWVSGTNAITFAIWNGWIDAVALVVAGGSLSECKLRDLPAAGPSAVPTLDTAALSALAALMAAAAAAGTRRRRRQGR